MKTQQNPSPSTLHITATEATTREQLVATLKSNHALLTWPPSLVDHVLNP